MRHMSHKRWISALGGSLVVLSGSALADAGYQDTTQITGGALVQMLRSIPFLPKSAKQVLDPMVTNVVLHGNQLARVSKISTEIIDLDQETVTRIDSSRKNYTVTTFEDMRQALKDGSKRLAEAQNEPDEPAAGEASRKPQYKVTFDVSLSNTGTSKPINGVLAKEQVLTMKAHVTPVDPPPADQPQSVTYSVITDIWSAPEPPEMRAVDEFYVRYGKKIMQGVDVPAILKSTQPALNQSGMTSLFASQPGMGSALPDMMKKIAVETAKIKGVGILTITRIGGEGMVAPSAEADAAKVAPGSSGPALSSAGTAAAQQVATDTTSAAVSEQVNKLGAIGSAFGNSVVSVFRRNMAPSAAGASPPAPESKGAAPPSSDGVLFEATTQKGAFSPEPVSASLFQVPPGYVKVESAGRTAMK
jgi:hypothetical protein